jgi:hypothetical protein
VRGLRGRLDGAVYSAGRKELSVRRDGFREAVEALAAIVETLLRP